MFGDFLLSEYLQIDISTFRNQSESSFYFSWLQIPFLEGSEFLWTVFFSFIFINDQPKQMVIFKSLPILSFHIHTCILRKYSKTNGNFQISPYSEFSYTYMYFEKVFSRKSMYFEKVLFSYESCSTFLFKPRFHQSYTFLIFSITVCHIFLLLVLFWSTISGHVI